MNRLASWINTVIVGYRRTLTDEQINGAACALCGAPLPTLDDRTDFGWIGLPGRRRAYTCQGACVITAVDEVEALFRAAIPRRQPVWFWHLGVDDRPLVTAIDGDDQADEAYLTALAAQPHLTVAIDHRNGTLTIRALPAEYAERIRHQAECLGFTARTTAVERSAA